MNSLSDLKNHLEKHYKVTKFIGYELTCELGTFTLGPDGLFLDNELLNKETIKEIINGKFQARKSKERKSRVSDVQATQGKRRTTSKTRKSRSAKSK